MYAIVQTITVFIQLKMKEWGAPLLNILYVSIPLPQSASCSCRQLTTQSTHGKPGEENSGDYTQKRLNHAVVTG